MLEDRSISLMSYNIETLLAEKLQTILTRGVLNTRMRDFYDVHVLLITRNKDIDKNIIKQAFFETCKNRQTENLTENARKIYGSITDDDRLASLWSSYQQKYSYAKDLDFKDVLGSLMLLLEIIV